MQEVLRLLLLQRNQIVSLMCHCVKCVRSLRNTFRLTQSASGSAYGGGRSASLLALRLTAVRENALCLTLRVKANAGKGIGGNPGSLVEYHPLFVVCLLALVCKETCVRVANIECSTGSVCLDVEEVQ